MAPVLILAIVLLVLGIIATVAAPAIGWVIPLIGLALLVAYLFGFGKKAAEPPA